MDWKSFHKKECAKLSGKGKEEKTTRDELGLMDSRSSSLRKQGVAKPRFPIEIADVNNEEHVFRGDKIAGYVTHMDDATGSISEKTKFFPYGIHIMPREFHPR